MDLSPLRVAVIHPDQSQTIYERARVYEANGRALLIEGRRRAEVRLDEEGVLSAGEESIEFDDGSIWELAPSSVRGCGCSGDPLRRFNIQRYLA